MHIVNASRGQHHLHIPPFLLSPSNSDKHLNTETAQFIFETFLKRKTKKKHERARKRQKGDNALVAALLLAHLAVPSQALQTALLDVLAHFLGGHVEERREGAAKRSGEVLFYFLQAK